MSENIQTISIVGSGNVASHLGRAFSEHLNVVSIYSRNQETGKELADELDTVFAKTIADLVPSDLVLVCVNDDAITEIIKGLPSHQNVAYSSGSVPLESIATKNNLGVVYPLQTFSKNREVNLFEVPFFIEATSTDFAQELFDLAWLLSRKVVFANSEDRKNLHVAAVMVNNFTNHINYLAESFLKSKSLKMDYLKPLIKETALKIQNTGPFDAQTGPAIRNDEATIFAHLDLLDEETKEIYALLTKSIQKHHSNK